MGDRFEWINAAPVLVSTVGRGVELGEDEVTKDLAFLLGNPDSSAYVIEGSRAELRAWVRVMGHHVGLSMVDGVEAVGLLVRREATARAAYEEIRDRIDADDRAPVPAMSAEERAAARAARREASARWSEAQEALAEVKHAWAKAGQA